MLDGLNCDTQSEKISNQKLHRANDFLNNGDLSNEGLSISQSRGSVKGDQPSQLDLESSHEIFPSRDQQRGLSIDRRNVGQK
jgi:hypothetical protein